MFTRGARVIALIALVLCAAGAPVARADPRRETARASDASRELPVALTIDAATLSTIESTMATPIGRVTAVMSSVNAFAEHIAGIMAPGPHPHPHPHPHPKPHGAKPYGDPSKGPCLPREQKVQIQGINGDFCSPSCSKASPCPADPYKGALAKPACVLQTPGSDGPDRCALVCDPRAGPTGGCPKGSACQPVAQVGICTYPM